MKTYKVIRVYQNGMKQTVRGMTRLSEEEAQAHCPDAETSSKTCTKPANVKRTKLRGPWVDCYDSE